MMNNTKPSFNQLKVKLTNYIIQNNSKFELLISPSDNLRYFESLQANTTDLLLLQTSKHRTTSLCFEHKTMKPMQAHFTLITNPQTIESIDLTYQLKPERKQASNFLLVPWPQTTTGTLSVEQLKDYHQLLNHICLISQVDYLILSVNDQQYDSYAAIDATVINDNLKLQPQNQTNTKILRLTREQYLNALSIQQTIQSGYQQQHWHQYSLPFNTVNTSVQIALAREAVKHLTGHVLDAGSGPAKLAFYLKNSQTITSYTAIDHNPQMVSIGKENLAKCERCDFNIIQSKIEAFRSEDIQQFNCVVSLNSYYTWPDPDKVLRHIFTLLQDNGIFVLATPSTNLDMAAIAEHCEAEQASHPHWQSFKQQNLALVNNPEAKFISMSSLISQCIPLGFEVEYCHQQHYLNGMNFIVFRKNAWYETTNHMVKQTLNDSTSIENAA